MRAQDRGYPLLRLAAAAISALLALEPAVPTVAAEEQTVPSKAVHSQEPELLVLCFHDIPEKVDLDPYGVDRETFVEIIEYLRTHGWTFISVDQMLAFSEGRGPLPRRAVLLTFDDAYRSFYEFVHPVLQRYGYPALLAVVTGWIGQKVDYIKQPVMSWEQLAEVAKDPKIEIASHSHDLHRGVRSNPQRNEAAAAVSLRFDPASGRYEDNLAYAARISADLHAAQETLRAKTGRAARIIVWPYGKYSLLSNELAKQEGFSAAFTLEDRIATAAELRERWAIPRYILTRNPTVAEFGKELGKHLKEENRWRVVQADLDLLYDKDPAQTERNLDAFLERIVTLKPNMVYLQAYADPQGTGNIKQVYFPTQRLRTRADLFNRVSHQLRAREMAVYAWMPMLAVIPPDPVLANRLQVRTLSGQPQEEPGYRRLSPFSAEARAFIAGLYEDLARHVEFDGVVFQDDGYLTDDEDGHPEALRRLRAALGPNVDPEELSDEQRAVWTQVKVEALTALTEQLKTAVRRYRPSVKFVRTIYPAALTDKDAAEWLAQDYGRCLRAYDYVAVMAYPRMERIEHPKRWLRSLVWAAAVYPGGLERTLFKVQSLDWSTGRALRPETVNQWLRWLVEAGAHHIGYYPDDYTVDVPEVSVIREMISAEDFPVRRR